MIKNLNNPKRRYKLDLSNTFKLKEKLKQPPATV